MAVQAQLKVPLDGCPVMKTWDWSGLWNLFKRRFHEDHDRRPRTLENRNCWGMKNSLPGYTTNFPKNSTFYEGVVVIGPVAFTEHWGLAEDHYI